MFVGKYELGSIQHTDSRGSYASMIQRSAINKSKSKNLL